MRLAFKPWANATCATDAPGDAALAQNLRLQLVIVTAPAAALGVLHGVHLSPWWTPSSPTSSSFSRRVRRTLTQLQTGRRGSTRCAVFAGAPTREKSAVTTRR